MNNMNVRKFNDFFVRLIFIILMIASITGWFLLFSENVQGVASDLYNEKLEFDSDGTLVMTTHDKKATTNIRYKTVGWIIKRYDMPVNAKGQQYVIIPMELKSVYIDDPNDNAYMYCTYYGNKDKINGAINRVSKEWKEQLENIGDYVYVDEILTIVEYGVTCGGVSDDCKMYGETYYDFEGISNARSWASKDSLRTHFNKAVYFPAQVNKKVYSYEVKEIEKVNKSSTPTYQATIGEGTRFSHTYDLQQAVPTGSSLYIEGNASKYYYNISYKKMRIKMNIPIQIVTSYILEWKNYAGVLQREKRQVIKYYNVERVGEYFLLDNYDINYLDSISMENRVFGEKITKSFVGCKPDVSFRKNSEYYKHVIAPNYKDVYYVDGGTISQMSINGVKPSIPIENRQSLAESFVEKIMVKNDFLKIGSITYLDDTYGYENSEKPKDVKYGGLVDVYITGIKIPDRINNSMINSTVGYYTYKNYKTGTENKKGIAGLKYINIHTPVYIEGYVKTYSDENDSEKNNENNICNDRINVDEEFVIVTNCKGQHIDKKGYGYNDYSSMISKKMVCFSEDVYKNEELIKANEWTELTDTDKFIIKGDSDNKDSNYLDSKDKINENTFFDRNINIQVKAYARNYLSVNDYENKIEDTANLSINNYVAICYITEIVTSSKEDKKDIVVGTH